MTRSQVREHLFKLLFRVEFNSIEEMADQERLYFEDSPADIEEDYESAGADIPLSDVDYIKNKYELLIQKLPAIDESINKSARGWSVKRIGKVELAILRLAIYEMIYDDSIPVGVAIDEAVDLAKKFGQDNAPAFINGVLAGVLKESNTEK